MENGFAFSGAKAYLLDRIVSVKDVFENLKAEYQAALISNLQPAGILSI